MPATLYHMPLKNALTASGPVYETQGKGPAPEMRHQTMEYLLAMTQPNSGASPPDRQLALELLAIAGGEGNTAEHAVIQRINLADQMFDQFLAEPHLPSGCLGLLEPLRFSVIKNALVDVGLLTQPRHPLRQILHNTLVSAVTSCTKGHDDLRQIETRIRDLPSLIDLSASFILPALVGLQPLSDAQIESFHEQLVAQAAERKQALADAVGRTVVRELENMTLGMKLPPGVVHFVQFGITPLLRAIMLKHGMDSVRWTAEISRVQNLLTSYEPANAARATDRSGLISNLILGLTSIGMPHDRIQKLISLLNASSR